MRILLIAGHGAGDPGALGTCQGRSCREADETRKLTAALKTALQGSAEVTVYPTDRNAYQDYRAGTLRTTAQFSRYDYVLEVHFNASLPSAADGENKGTEIFVTASEAGTTVEEAILRELATLGLRDRGVKRQDWAVIRTAKASGVSAALLEVCFIDDPDDMAIYAAQGAERAASAVAAGIRAGFGLPEPADQLAAARKKLKERAGLTYMTLDYLEAYRYGDDLLKKLAAAMG